MILLHYGTNDKKWTQKSFQIKSSKDSELKLTSLQEDASLGTEFPGYDEDIEPDIEHVPVYFPFGRISLQ